MSGFIYFLGDPMDWSAPIKIGYTAKNPRARMASVQTGCPFRLSVLAYTAGSKDLERRLHKVFSPVRRCGEWFSNKGVLTHMAGTLFIWADSSRQLSSADFSRVTDDYLVSPDIPNEDWTEDQQREYFSSADFSAWNGGLQ